VLNCILEFAPWVSDLTARNKKWHDPSDSPESIAPAQAIYRR